MILGAGFPNAARTLARRSDSIVDVGRLGNSDLGWFRGFAEDSVTNVGREKGSDGAGSAGRSLSKREEDEEADFGLKEVVDADAHGVFR